MRADPAVRPVLGEEDLLAFVRLPRRIFRDTRNWLPAPESDDLALLRAQSNPFHRRAEVELYVAERGDEVVARLAVFRDPGSPQRLGCFGFFDALHDPESVQGLLDAAQDWCRARGCTRMLGPIDFWTILSAGVMVDGFDHPNYVGSHLGKPYYADLLTEAGFEPLSDLAVWEYGARPIPPPARAIADAVDALPELAIERFDPSSDDAWRAVAEVYAAAYLDETLYFPVGADELRAMSGDRVDPEISFLAWVNDQPAAVAIGWRNSADASLRIGDVLPPEPVQRMWRIANKPRSWRQWLFAVRPEYRGRAVGGLGMTLYVRVRDAADAAGYGRGETAFTSTVAAHLRDGLTVLGAEHYKTYRVFERTL